MGKPTPPPIKKYIFTEKQKKIGYLPRKQKKKTICAEKQKEIDNLHRKTKRNWKLAQFFMNIGFLAEKFVIFNAKSVVQGSWKVLKHRGFFAGHIKRWRHFHNYSQILQKKWRISRLYIGFFRLPLPLASTPLPSPPLPPTPKCKKPDFSNFFLFFCANCQFVFVFLCKFIFFWGGFAQKMGVRGFCPNVLK